MEMLAALDWTRGLLDRFQNSNDYDLPLCPPLPFSPSNSWNALLPVYNETLAFGISTNGGDSRYQLEHRKALTDGYQEYLKCFRQWSYSNGSEFSI
ncbi:hypothetical protein P171DRAFT_426792 [Karstenula rhodostoma CBS 690.94]|uniref:Uncharacterized protein n=1 Tax=Karstenula rhodostoma CBS 690.94 TaxID=1392251 RepID=A0A9P4UFU5_9PLEO|nr:hypothetical protein P171DRAFT_426792 [Karstenula rhodostoma CBS 690.94]